MRSQGVILGVALMGWAHSVAAQGPAAGPPPPHIASMEPGAELTRDNRRQLVGTYEPVVPGDTIATGSGRLEILAAPFVRLGLDAGSGIRLVESPSRWWLDAGAVAVTLEADPLTGARLPLGIDSDIATLLLESPGRYILEHRGPSLALEVSGGEATVLTSVGAWRIGSGESALVTSGRPPMPARAPISAVTAGLARWAAALRRERADAIVGAPLPVSLHAYAGVLAAHGTWQRAEAGLAWYPRVGSAWQPFTTGTWRHLPPYGPTWVDTAIWAWPTHHYGRWDRGSRGWHWLPGEAWSPAPVVWAVGPGLVGWCPLGLGLGPTDLTGERDLFQANGAYDPPTGWVVVDRRTFDEGRRTPVRSGARLRTDGQRLPIVVQQRAPARRVTDSDRAIRVHGSPGASTDRPRSNVRRAAPPALTPWRVRQQPSALPAPFPRPQSGSGLSLPAAGIPSGRRLGAPGTMSQAVSPPTLERSHQKAGSRSVVGDRRATGETRTRRAGRSRGLVAEPPVGQTTPQSGQSGERLGRGGSTGPNGTSGATSARPRPPVGRRIVSRPD